MRTIKTLASHVSAVIFLSLLTNAAHAALVDMAEYQDWEGIESSISSADINAVQPDGMTALLWATYYDEVDVVRLLLNAGANPNIENRYGMVPLIQAGINGNSEMISMLLDAGANPNARTPEGDNAILNASKSGALEGVQALIAAGADVNSRDGYLFQTPLMWAASSNQAEIVRVLIENGADMDARSAELDLRGVLIDTGHGDLPNGGLTALHHAAREHAIEATEVLLSMGADPNISDPQEITPLRVAFINSHLDLAKILIEGGADINDGSFVDLVHVKFNELIIGRSETNHEDESSVADIMNLMLDMGVDLEAYPSTAFPYPGTRRTLGKGTSGQTALFVSTSFSNLEFMSALLEHGANPNSLNMEEQYFPLSAALDVVTARGEEYVGMSMDDMLPAAGLLIKHGADINAVAKDGTTVLHHAAALGRTQVVEYLIAQGADLSVKDSSNRTALDVANGIAKVGVDREMAYYESTATLLYQAMSAQGVAIEDYVAPATEENSDEA